MQAQLTHHYDSPITDVVTFFDGLIFGYLSFEKSVTHVANRLPSLTPLQIDIECQKLIFQRENLRRKDVELLQILELAGQELKNHKLLDEYRISFARASLACDMLKEDLSLMRISLSLEELF